VALGLIVRPSFAGLVIGSAALLAFLSRTPLKLALVDRYRHRRLPRSVLAERVAGGELLLTAALAAEAARAGAGWWWAPIAIAAPLVAVELWFDARSRSRRLVPELCGAVAMASVAAAITVAGGATSKVAAACWAVLAARSVASVPFARFQVERSKGHPGDRRSSDIAQVVALAAIWAGLAAGVVPLIAAATVTTLVALQWWAARNRPPAIAVLGAAQVVAGVAVVVATGLALRPG